MQLYFRLYDVTEDTIREELTNFWQSSGRTEELTPFSAVEDQLIAGHDYTLSLAIETPVGLSPWSTPIAVLAEATGSNTLTRAEFVYTPTVNHSLSLSWAMSEPEHPVLLEIETRIDVGEWRPTALVSSGTSHGYETGAQILHVETGLFAENGLDAAHGFFYSDGQPHSVEARIRIQGETDEWNVPPVTLPLYAPWRPVLNYWEGGFIQAPVYLFQPHFFLDVAPGWRYDFYVGVDQWPPMRYGQFSETPEYHAPRRYLPAIPDEKLDGAYHDLTLEVRLYHNDLLKTHWIYPGQSVQLPPLALLKPPILDVHEWQWWPGMVDVIVDGMPSVWAMAVAVFVDGNRQDTVIASRPNPHRLRLTNLVIPDDDRAHPISVHATFTNLDTGRTTDFVSSSPGRALFLRSPSMAVTVPSNVISTFKKIRDPFSNLQTGYEITARLGFVESQLHVQAAVDFNATFTDCTFNVISAFPPMIRISGITIPQDGLSHPIVLKLWHDDGTEQSAVVTTDPLVAMFDMNPPPVPTGVVVTVLRDRVGSLPDQVQIDWTSNDDVNILCLDDEGKKRPVGIGSESESSFIVEGISKYGTQDGEEHTYRLGVQAFNRSAASTAVYSDPFNLHRGSAAVVEETPDDVAGTVVHQTHADFLSGLATAFPAVESGTITAIFNQALTKIKEVISKGGSVTMADFGLFKANWSQEKVVFRNGQYITIPAVRSAGFQFSNGFAKGTKLGRVMTDTEAAIS